MARYSKSYSNYILRKVHTTVNGGTIFERDWSTLGERHVIEPGKKKIYSDGNFLFTDNNTAGLQKRNFTGEWSEPYTLDNIDPNINGKVNDTTILSPSNDLRDYAYYGSAAELVRATVEKIIREFPGRVYSENARLQRYDETDGEWLVLDSVSSDDNGNFTLTWGNDPYNGLWAVRNPFNIDLSTQDPVLGPNDNRMRSLPLSWQLYLCNGGAIGSWNVWTRPYTECVDDYDVICEITFSASDGPRPCEMTLVADDGKTPCRITVSNGGGSGQTQFGHIWCIQHGRETVWVTDMANMEIRPDDTLIEKYFAGLQGLEAQLLSRVTEPRYSVRFITPFRESELDARWQYSERRYTWPSTGYCIDIDTIAYFNYLSRLNSLATTLDTLWCDNLWENMTHEAIKNFDWTYTREYADGEEAENVLGGTRMQGMLRVMGRYYDDIKRYIDGISLKNRVTYDGVFNIGHAEVSDKAELLGWEVFSTKEFDNMNLTLGQYALTVPKQEGRYGTALNHSPWYDTSNPEYVDQNTVDNDFMRRLVLSAGQVFRTKGTRHCIDMVMGLFGIGDDDYTVEERYYSVEPKRRDDVFWFYQPNDDPDADTEYQHFEDYPTLESYLEFMHYELNDTCPEHVMFDDGCYDLRGDLTVGEFCKYVTGEKNIRRNYPDDEFSGAPLKDVYIGNQHVLVPYFSQLKLYDGNVQFETNGGWGKMADEPCIISQLSRQEYDYLETVPYMEVVQKVGELMTVNVYDVKGKQIYYVMDLSDLSEYVETIPNTVSHFFKLTDPFYPNLFSSWRNVPVGIDVSDLQEFDDYCNETDGDGEPVRELMFGVTYEDWKLARYLDSIMPDNIGNNPHVGFGLYDLGAEYRRYLEKPLRYAAENYGFYDYSMCRVADQFRYEVAEHCGEKIKNLVHGDPMDDDVVNLNCSDDTEDCVTFNCGERYYEPRKLLIIKNNIDSEDYRRYFMDVIIKYLLQVIASTTILVLVGFKPEGECVKFACEVGDGGPGGDSGGEITPGGGDDNPGGGDTPGGGDDNPGGGDSGGDSGGGGSSGFKLRCWVVSTNKNQGTVEGDGYYPYLSKVTIDALPNEGYEFKYWLVSDELTQTRSYTKRQTITLKRNMKYVAIFKEAASNGQNQGSSDVTITFKVSPENSGPSIWVNDSYSKKTKHNIQDEYTLTVPKGTSIMFSATGTSVYQFSHWGGGPSQNPDSFDASYDRTITAFFKEYDEHTIKWLSADDESELANVSEYIESQTFIDYYIPIEVPMPAGSLKRCTKVVVPLHHRVELEYFDQNGTKQRVSLNQDSNNFTQGLDGIPADHKVQWYNFAETPQYLETGDGIEPPKLIVTGAVGA